MSEDPESLATWLQGLSSEDLLALVQLRLPRTHRPPTSFDVLASSLSALGSCVEALQLVDRGAAQVAGLAAARGNRVQVAELVEALSLVQPVDTAYVEGCLERLAAFGLAWPVADGRAWRTVTCLAPLSGQLLEQGLPWRAAARGLMIQTLRTAAGLLQLEKFSSLAEGTAELGLVLEDRQRLGRLLDTAPPEVAPLVERFVTGEVDVEDLGPAATWLAQRCLLFSGQDGEPVLLAELLSLVRRDGPLGAVAREPRPAPVAAVAPPADQALHLLDQVRALLNLVETTGLKALQSGGVGVQEQRRLAVRSA